MTVKNEVLKNLFLDSELSDEIEAFAFWIGLCCGNKVMVRNGDSLELMWYLHEEADVFFDGHKDKRTPLYTIKELLRKYYDIRISKNKQQ